MTKFRQKRDSYLRRKYNIWIEYYDELFRKCKGRCSICKHKYNKEGKLLILHVDHWHWLATLKVISFKVDNIWHARVKEKKLGWIVERSYKRNVAIKAVKRILLRMSVRGLLCWPCNSGLRKWQDNAWKIQRAAQYLEKYIDSVNVKRIQV